MNPVRYLKRDERTSAIYFKDLPSYYIFILIYTDGRFRCDSLKIREVHYNPRYKQLAKDWYDGISNILDLRIDHPEYHKAKAELLKVYKRMVD